MRALRYLLLILPMAAAWAQSSVQATGHASISVQPDQAQLTAGVVTQAANAQDAAQQNATQAAAIINALKSLLGSNGTVQTIGYSVSPRYNNANPPVIIGYTASNTVQVTTFNLNQVGPLIDAANQAGANSIGGISFGLQDPEPVVQQALGKAAKTALAHASAIAQGLGAKTGAVLAAQEGSSVTPLRGDIGATATVTPVQTGMVTVSATVTVSLQLLQ